MLFHSIPFLCLFLPVLALYFGVPSEWWKFRRAVLLLASYVFYASWNPPFLLLLWATTFLDYWAGLRIADGSPAARKRWLVASLGLNLVTLAFFKYSNFLAGNLSWAIELPPPFQRFLQSIVLPLGISFYTLQSMSYTIDMYRRTHPPCRSFFDFQLFVSFFPQLVAGPILRADEFLPQLAIPKKFDAERVRVGTALFFVGLAKKVLGADPLAGFVDPVFADPASFSPLSLLLGVYAFAFQIYFDFSGYTDMGIGLAKILGFELVENFRHPYVATSIVDFWRRWHLSLSRWLRDYLYISLGGNRQGEWQTYGNLMLTMLLGGLWHGASWTFVLWGGYHGLLLAIEKRFFPAVKVDGIFRRAAAVLVTFHLVLVGWFLFRIRDLTTAGTYLSGLMNGWGPVAPSEIKGILVLAFFFLLHALSGARNLRTWFATTSPVLQGAVCAGVLAVLACLRNETQEFIYFQF